MRSRSVRATQWDPIFYLIEHLPEPVIILIWCLLTSIMGLLKAVPVTYFQKGTIDGETFSRMLRRSDTGPSIISRWRGGFACDQGFLQISSPRKLRMKALKRDFWRAVCLLSDNKAQRTKRKACLGPWSQDPGQELLPSLPLGLC